MKIARFLLGGILGALVGLAILVPLLFLGPGKSAEKERFVINLDTSEEKAVDSLVQKGFLRSKNLFSLILTLKGWHGKIEPGAYLLAKNMNAYQLAKTLIAGPYQKWVIIPPGKRKEQVAVILRKSLGWSEELSWNFITVAEEGYLFPDTYLIVVEATAEEVVGKLKANFNEKFDSQLQKDLLAQNIRNDTAIKVASLIERESGGDEDKPIIAGIIWNRLNKKMRLEIDATVQYAAVAERFLSSRKEDQVILDDSFVFWPKVSAEMLRAINSPYNTYLNEGLPPAPICSPGLSSIKAAIYPAKTEAFYYLHSPDKQIHTAKTYKEHQENIEKYLK